MSNQQPQPQPIDSISPGGEVRKFIEASIPSPPMPCRHESFAANAAVDVLTGSGGAIYRGKVQWRCAKCGVVFVPDDASAKTLHEFDENGLYSPWVQMGMVPAIDGTLNAMKQQSKHPLLSGDVGEGDKASQPR